RRAGLSSRRRRFRSHGRRRRRWDGRGAPLIGEAESVGWLLAEVARRAGWWQGRPREIIVPLPGSLTPNQVLAFREVAEHVSAFGRIRCSLNHGPGRGWLDEASAIAFYWLWESSDELSAW